MQFLEKWIEYDYNPFILFDSTGKVVSLNKEAQYLLGEIPAKEIYELAHAYASLSYGFKTTILDLEFGSYKFFGLCVGYENEREIGIKLYKNASPKFSHIAKNGESANIYALLDLTISASATKTKAIYKKEFDPTFPELYLHVESFIKLLSKIYESFKDSQTICTKLQLKTGEYIKFNEKKYPIFMIGVEGESKNNAYEFEIANLAKSINCITTFKTNQIIITTAFMAT